MCSLFGRLKEEKSQGTLLSDCTSLMFNLMFVLALVVERIFERIIKKTRLVISSVKIQNKKAWSTQLWVTASTVTWGQLICNAESAPPNDVFASSCYFIPIFQLFYPNSLEEWISPAERKWSKENRNILCLGGRKHDKNSQCPLDGKTTQFVVLTSAQG